MPIGSISNYTLMASLRLQPLLPPATANSPAAPPRIAGGGLGSLLRPLAGPILGRRRLVLPSAHQDRVSPSPASPSPAPPLLGRRSANYQPSFLNSDYVNSWSSCFQESQAETLEKMKETTRRLLATTRPKPAAEKLQLVDTLQQLGVAYHFRDEIDDILGAVYGEVDKLAAGDGDLYTVSLAFRLLREQKLPVCQNIFKRFTDGNGIFESGLCADVKGMLSLYEASFLATDADDLLHSASAFSAKHLREAAARGGETLDPRLKKRVRHALENPIHWTVGRFHARWFIDTGFVADGGAGDAALLHFAKLDFNDVQRSYKIELRELSRWWSSMALQGEKLSFSRDRLVENFFWAGGWAEEPRFWRVRDILTKAVCLVTTMDDVYDVFGSVEELEIFTRAIERWDAGETATLPECMKMMFFAIINTTNEFAYTIVRDKGVDTLDYLKRAWADLCKAYLQEAKWYHSGRAPALDEYMINATASISGQLQTTMAFCASEELTQEAMRRYEVYPHLIRAPSLIFRLYDDLGTSTEEMQRGDVPKSVQLYMREYGIEEAAAREKVMELVAATWRELNGELLAMGPPAAVSLPEGGRRRRGRYEESFEVVAVNMARNARSFYQYGDGYGTTNGVTNQRIASAIIDPVHV